MADPAESADGFDRDWQALRADETIQFTPFEMPQMGEPPGWLTWLAGLLSDAFMAIARLGSFIGLSGTAIVWICVAAGAILLLLLLARLVAPLLKDRARAPAAGEDAQWRPAAQEARTLLEDADRLAAEGRFDEATRLLLARSVAQIEAARPGLLDPSSTAREIATLAVLPATAREAFGAIADRVERSLFALRTLSAEDWRTARTAYADFAARELQTGT